MSRYKYKVNISISNEDKEKDNIKLEYEYESKDNAYDLMENLKEEIYVKEPTICIEDPTKGKNKYNISIEVENKGDTSDFTFIPSYYAYGSLNIVSDNVYDIQTIIDSIMY